MSDAEILARGPTLRIVCVNDVYSLEHLPRLYNLVRQQMAQNPADGFFTTLAGDFVAPSMLSSLDKGRGMIECLNVVGIDYVIFGNHEDDIHVDELRERIREFRGTWLNTNIPNFVPKLPTHQIVEVAAPAGRTVRVGLVGVVMSDDTVYRRKPFGGVPIDPANESVDKTAAWLLQQEGCACVIPLTHQDLADDRALARAPIASSFPLIIGGHEHSAILEQVASTWIVKAGSDAKLAAIVDLSWPAQAPATGPDLPTVQVRLEPVANYPEESSLRARIQARMARVHEIEAATLMRLPHGTELSSVGARAMQTPMGMLLATRIRDALGSDGCVLNGGGVRGNRTYRDRFTYGDLKAEVPFDNELVVVELPGAVLREAIRASRAQAPIEAGGFLQVDNRMTVALPDNELIAIAGGPLDEKRLYRIALIRNLLTGMDHIEPLVRYAQANPSCLPQEGSGREIKVVLVDAFSVELWKQLGPFELVDSNRDGKLSESEIAAAITRVTAAPASQVTIDLLIRAGDTNFDRMISVEEAERLLSKPKP